MGDIPLALQSCGMHVEAHCGMLRRRAAPHQVWTQLKTDDWNHNPSSSDFCIWARRLDRFRGQFNTLCHTHSNYAKLCFDEN